LQHLHSVGQQIDPNAQGAERADTLVEFHVMSEVCEAQCGNAAADTGTNNTNFHSVATRFAYVHITLGSEVDLARYDWPRSTQSKVWGSLWHWQKDWSD
jgi:hypothetical protein